ncbi:MAG TPA: sodium:proton antiporter [Nitrososphaeraceae archaeon]
MIVFDSIISVSSNSSGGGGSSNDILTTSEYLILIFLAMIFAAALFSSRTKVPYTMGLVGIGIAISLFLGLARGEVGGLNILNFNRLDPKLIIDFIIPPLIFEAMMKVDYYNEFKAIRVSALLLATLGVVIATVVTGLLLMYLAHLPLLIAFTFAALIAPTDAAIVIEIFKRVRGVPGLLSTIMESEATLNDATGIIVFSSIITLASYSYFLNSGGSFSSNIITNNFIVYEIVRFIIVFFGGVAIGLGIAAATHRLHSLMNDPFSETALTIATVFGSVVLANSLGVSGLVAVAVAGLYFGNATVKKEADMSLKVRTAVFNFWEMAAFFANSVAFLYLGISMNILRIAENFPLIALAFVAVLVARAVSTYPILAVTNRLTREKIPVIWRHVIMLGGMRGAISVALVASIPSTAAREFKTTLETITFGVVLLSLVIQYIVLTKYVRKAFPKDTAIAANVDNTNLPED